MDVRLVLAKAIDAHRLGKLTHAESMYLSILKQSPGHVDALHLLGVIRNQQGRPGDAVALFKKAIKVNPKAAAFHSNLGNAYLAMGKYGEAEAVFRKAIHLKPDFAEAHNNLGQSFLERKQYDKAEPCFRRAIECWPDFPEAHDNLGIALRELGRLEEAATAYRRAIQLRPTMIKAHDNLAQVCQQMGKIEEGIKACLAALRLDDHYVPAYARLIQMHYKGLSDSQINILSERANDGKQPSEERSQAHFSLGMLFDRRKAYAKAFEHFSRGNALGAKPFNIEGHESWVRDIQTLFKPGLLDGRRDRCDSDLEDHPVPLFIVGMPRSGTTLVEQILSAHPQVYGAGELDDIGDLALKSGYPWKKNVPKSSKLDAMAHTYLTRIKTLAGDINPQVITNKMPANFLYLGFITMLFGEKARVIHVRRNPMDTCLSCYFQQFVNLAWSYELHHIGRYYRTYLSMMDHWRSLPIPMTEVAYEDLVTQPEREIKRMLDACGLPWDARCLVPENNERAVKTASVIQVRQPIHRQSVERWKAYEPWLGDLHKALGDI